MTVNEYTLPMGAVRLFSAKTFARALAVSALFFLSNSPSLFGQTIWKSQAEITITIGEEKTRMEASLALPDLPVIDRAIYTSYKRLMDFVETNIAGGMSVDDAIVRGHEIVLAEAPKHPDTERLTADYFQPIVDGLREALTKVPEAEIGN